MWYNNKAVGGERVNEVKRKDKRRDGKWTGVPRASNLFTIYLLDKNSKVWYNEWVVVQEVISQKKNEWWRQKATEVSWKLNNVLQEKAKKKMKPLNLFRDEHNSFN